MRLTSMTWNALLATGEKIRNWIIDTPVPDRADGRDHRPVPAPGRRLRFGHVLRRALLGHRRRPAGRLLRRPAGDLPQHPRAGQHPARDQEVFASLYNDRAISYRVHWGFAHADVALSAGVQRMVRSDTGAAGVMFHLDTNPASATRSSSPPATASAKRWCRALLTRTSSTLPEADAGRRQEGVIRRNLGSKMIKMGSPPRRSQQVHQYRRRAGGWRHLFSINDTEVEELARYAMIIESTTAARWTSNGARTATTASSTSCRPAPNGEVAEGHGACRKIQAEAVSPGAHLRPRHRPEDRRRPGPRRA